MEVVVARWFTLVEAMVEEVLVVMFAGCCCLYHACFLSRSFSHDLALITKRYRQGIDVVGRVELVYKLVEGGGGRVEASGG